MKNKLFLSVLLISLCLSGCGEGNVRGTKVSSVGYYTPDISEMGDNFAAGYSYLIDNSTGVVYLKYENGYGKSITVMLKADGTPLMKEDIINVERCNN